MLWKQVAMLQVPMLAVVGSDDIRPSWSVEQVVNLMPNARFQRLEGAGHYLWLTHSHQLKVLLQSYLKLFLPE